MDHELLKQVNSDILLVEETLRKHRASSSPSCRRHGAARYPLSLVIDHDAILAAECSLTASSNTDQLSCMPQELATKEGMSCNSQDPVLFGQMHLAAVGSSFQNSLVRSRSSSPGQRHGASYRLAFETTTNDWLRKHQDFCVSAQRDKTELSHRDYVWRQRCNLLQRQLLSLQSQPDNPRTIPLNPKPPAGLGREVFQCQKTAARILRTSVSRQASFRIGTSSASINSTATCTLPRARSLEVQRSCPVSIASSLPARLPFCGSGIRSVERISTDGTSTRRHSKYRVRESASHHNSQSERRAQSPMTMPSAGLDLLSLLSLKNADHNSCAQDEFGERLGINGKNMTPPAICINEPSTEACYEDFVRSQYFHDDFMQDVRGTAQSAKPAASNSDEGSSMMQVCESHVGVTLPPTPVTSGRESTHGSLALGNTISNWLDNGEETLSVSIASLHNAILGLNDHLKDSKFQQKKFEDAIMEIEQQVRALQDHVGIGIAKTHPIDVNAWHL